MISRPDTAAIVQKALSDLAPGSVKAVELDGIKPLDLDGPAAARAVTIHAGSQTGAAVRPATKASRRPAGR
jgi:hypothetical protein